MRRSLKFKRKRNFKIESDKEKLKNKRNLLNLKTILLQKQSSIKVKKIAPRQVKGERQKIGTTTMTNQEEREKMRASEEMMMKISQERKSNKTMMMKNRNARKQKEMKMMIDHERSETMTMMMRNQSQRSEEQMMMRRRSLKRKRL